MSIIAIVNDVVRRQIADDRRRNGPRFIVTVDRAAIDAGNNAAIRVSDERAGKVTNYTEVTLGGRVVVRHGPQRQDGARVWIEADEISGTMQA